MVFLLHTWIYLCAIITAAGWVLSYFGQLNRLGYSAVLGLFAAAFLYFFPKRGMTVVMARGVRRFRKPAPALFLLLAVLASIGGLIYLPVHYDAYSYRIPRVFHWLAEEKWHWIHSADMRLNVVATGFDWLTAPLISVTRSLNSIVLINIISFFLLPGATFLALSNLGVRKKVAWWWMWLFPAGYCYVFQAGSIATDAFAAVFTLAAIGFALRSRRSKSLADVWTSTLAIALATGAKQSNIPLGLPWLIAIWPSLRLLFMRPLNGLALMLLSSMASVIPLTAANLYQGLHWSGFGQGHDYAPTSPLWGILGNSFWLTAHNLFPPINPWSHQWNAMMRAFLDSQYGEPFRAFELFGYAWRAASEQFSGIGVALFGLVLMTWAAGKLQRPHNVRPDKSYLRWVRWGVWFAFLVFMSRIGINQITRYAAPYYILLLSSLLISPGLVPLTRARWWRTLALLMMLSTAGLLFLSRQRPLFPAETIATLLQQHFPEKQGVRKVVASYTFFSEIRRGIQPLIDAIPPEVRLVGYATRSGDKEPWIWMPLWSRSVLRVSNSDSPEEVRSRGLRFIIVDQTALQGFYDPALVREIPSARSRKMTIEEWLEEYRGRLVATVELRAQPEAPPELAYLVRLLE